jgi:hypothetical protein
MGFAASSKLLGLYAALALGVVVAALVAWRSGPWCQRLVPLGRYTFSAVLVGSPWYLRTWWETGDPFWPALVPWLGGVEGSVAVYREAREQLQALAPLAWDAPTFLRTLANAIAGGPSIWGRSFIGPMILGGLPLLALSARAARRSGWMLGWAIIYCAAWFSLAQYGRYLLPAFVALSVAAGMGLMVGQQFGCAARFAIRSAVILWGVTSLTAALSQLMAFGPVTVGREPPERFLARQTSYDAEIRWMNAHLPSDAVVASDHAGLYYLDRRSIWLNGVQGFIDYQAIKNVNAFHLALGRWGVTHLFLTTTAMDSQLSDDRSAALTHDLASRCGTVIYQNPQAVFVTSVLLEQREASAASIISLAGCDRPDN